MSLGSLRYNIISDRSIVQPTICNGAEQGFFWVAVHKIDEQGVIVSFQQIYLFYCFRTHSMKYVYSIEQWGRFMQTLVQIQIQYAQPIDCIFFGMLAERNQRKECLSQYENIGSKKPCDDLRWRKKTNQRFAFSQDGSTPQN